MKGIIYVRVSDPGQVDGTSLDSQETACREYAQRNNIAIEKVFVEKGESAKFRDRTELINLIEFCRKHKDIGALIVWKVDRFARNIEDHLAIKAELARYGTAVCSVTEPISDTPVGKLTEMMLAVIAEFDNAIRATRSKGGMQSKIKSGIYPLRPPLGYMSANPRGAKKINPDMPDPERFVTMQEAWRLVLSGSFTKADVVRFFKNRGLTTRAGTPVNAKLVDKIFQNKYYAGILSDPWDNNREYPAQHKAMLTPEEFAQVQRVLSRRSNSRPHLKDRSDFPLRGFVRCRSCLRPMTGSWSRGRSKKYPYYHCYSGTCSRYGKGLSRETLEKQFMDLLAQYAPRPRLIPVLERRLRRHWNGMQTGHEEKIKRYRSQSQALERENSELIQMRRRNLISDSEFTRNHDSLNNEMQSVHTSLGEVQAAVRFDDKDVASVLDFLTSLCANWARTAFPFRRRFQNAVFSEGLVEGQFGTAKKSEVFTLIEHFKSDYSTTVDLSADFWNRVILEFAKLAKLIRESDVFESDPKQIVPNSGTEAVA
jgi:site-specific DNA recombinase